MKILKLTLLFSIALILVKCDEPSTITPTGNLDEYLKYTVDNEPEQIFDNEVVAYMYVDNNSIKSLVIDAKATAVTNSGSNTTKTAGAKFSFPTEAVFLNNTTFPWGYSDGTSHNFYFASIENRIFLDNSNSPNITGTVTMHPTSLNDYIEFTFQGTYIVGGTTKNISGSGRAKRETNPYQ